MATSEGDDHLGERNTTKIYNREGMTSVPIEVREHLGGISKGGIILWEIDEDTGEVTVEAV